MRYSNRLYSMIAIVPLLVLGCASADGAPDRSTGVNVNTTSVVKTKDSICDINCDPDGDPDPEPGGGGSWCQHNPPRCCEWDDVRNRCAIQVSGCRVCP